MLALDYFYPSYRLKHGCVKEPASTIEMRLSYNHRNEEVMEHQDRRNHILDDLLEEILPDLDFLPVDSFVSEKKLIYLRHYIFGFLCYSSLAGNKLICISVNF